MNRSQKFSCLRVFGVFALLSALATLSACTSLQTQFEQPDVRLVKVVFLEGGLLEQVYAVTLRVDNPNDFSLPIKGVSYAVKLGGRDFASGLTPNAFSVPANGTEDIAIQVHTNLLQTLGHLSRLLSDRPTSLDYELSGRVRVKMRFIREIPFSQSGTIPLTTRQSAASETI